MEQNLSKEMNESPTSGAAGAGAADEISEALGVISEALGVAGFSMISSHIGCPVSLSLSLSLSSVQ